MNNNSSGSTLLCFVFLVVIGLLVWLCIYLVRKGQTEAKQVEAQQLSILQGLPQDKQMIFSMQYNNVQKNVTTATLLALFLGGIGLHKFYMGSTGTGIIYLLLCWTGIPALIAFFEAFGMSGTVSRFNLEKAREIAVAVGGRSY